ncbi:hypothetical protein BDV96DRAFT_614176 [Lophiotrema nucula]|uniref:(4-O-methyl)-D-glucuronate--lignin esterase n=1 Tax=Lophiotrema nucula TaxID=690887 RepID=A0A6A5Z122_9PLEO|nr:hypothetical protein BDV96DRAFT_614176 [Lophiotrema nucula]
MCGVTQTFYQQPCGHLARETHFKCEEHQKCGTCWLNRNPLYERAEWNAPDGQASVLGECGLTVWVNEPSHQTNPRAIRCPSLPATISYATNPKLPDPFLSIIGTRITSASQWTCRKEEIRQLYQRHSLGTMPPKPSNVTASLSGASLKIVVTDGGKSTSFSVTIKTPASGTAPYPAIIAFRGGSIPIPSNVATITYQNFDIGADNGRGKGKFYDLYGSGHSAGAMITWAGFAPRKRVGATGCSRNGKGAMVAGAFEDRIILSLPQEGGQGSAGCWRIADEIQKNGTKYVDTVPALPWDGHLLHSLYATPNRGLLIIENTAIDYLGPTSNFHCASAGRKVFGALSVMENFGISQNSHSDHCGFPKAQQPELTAFVERFLLGKDTKTDVWKTDGEFVQDLSRWVDWNAPKLS